MNEYCLMWYMYVYNGTLFILKQEQNSVISNKNEYGRYYAKLSKPDTKMTIMYN